jgi:uncharacterized membrane protein YkvA (DUF1232 family)
MDGTTPWLVVAIVAVAMYAAFVLALVAAGQRRQARALAAFLPHCAVLLKRLVRDPRVPRSRKIVLAALTAYLAMPFDLVPDFIPVAGQLDDAILIALALRSLVRKAGPGLLREHWPGSPPGLRALLRLAGAREK